MAIGVAATAQAAPVAGFHSAGLRRISGPMAFPACSRESRETAPTLAVNPAHPRRLIASWLQAADKSQANVVATSGDAGASWSRRSVPGNGICTGGWGYDEDPAAALGGDGVAYLTTLQGDDSTQTFEETGNFSSDGGRHWGGPVVLDHVRDGQTVGSQDDYGAVIAERGRAGTADVVFGRPFPNPATMGTLFTRTADGGHTWTAPAYVHHPSPGTTDLFAQIAQASDGTLLVSFIEVPIADLLAQSSMGTVRDVGVDIYLARSRDRGATWSASKIGMTRYTVPQVATGPHGLAYVAWDDDSAPQGRIRLASSTDSGESWRPAQTIVSKPGQVLAPALAVGRGTLGVTWLDQRHAKPGDAQHPTDVWFASSSNRGVTWHEIHLAGPFELNNSDYLGRAAGAGLYTEGLTAQGSGFAAVFAAGRPLATDGPSDIFFTPIARGLPPLRLTIRPSRAHVGHRATFHFTVTALDTSKAPAVDRPVSGATIHFAGHRLITGRAGRAELATTFTRPGRRRAVATAAGYSAAQIIVKVDCRDADHDRDCDGPNDR